MRYNKLVDTDAQGRPAAARRPSHGRRSHARYMAWAQFMVVVRGFVQERCFGGGARLHPARRGAFQIVGARVRWLARVTSSTTAGQPRHGCADGRSVPGEGAWLVQGHAASGEHAFHGQHRPQCTKVTASNATASHNKLVDTDAQGRPAAARRPTHGRRSHARYVAWAQFMAVVLGFVREQCFGDVPRLRPARRGAFLAVGERVSWLARVTSRATAGQPRHGCVDGRSVPGQCAWLARGHAASGGHAIHGQHRPQRTKVVPSNATASHNTLVDTDAQGRPLPSVAPAPGRRSHARCTARKGIGA